MNIGETIYDIFGNDEWGILLCIFLIFFIDALVFPTLPELFFIIGFMYKPDLVFGMELLGVAILAEFIGISILYLVVKHIRIPHKVERVVDKYIGFLIMGDERLLLLNRVAPMIPFAGAFICIAKWNYYKSMIFIAIGCVLKYGVIMLMSDFFYDYFSGPDAQRYTLVFIIAVIAISFVFSFLLKKKTGLDKDQAE